LRQRPLVLMKLLRPRNSLNM